MESIVLAIMDDVDDRPLGLLTAEFNERSVPFTELDAEIVAGAALLARGSLINQRVRRQNRAAAEERREMLRRLAEVEERERRRLGDDLHDDVLQRVTSVAHFLEIIAGRVTDADDRELLERVHREALDSAVSLRRLVSDLHPIDAEATSLRSVLEGVAFAADTRAELVARLVVRRDGPTSPAVTTTAHRIARQAVDNAVAHGNPSEIVIELDVGSDAVVVQVSDDGVGFDVAAQPSGIGLFSMIERARQLGGRCIIESSPGGGTVIRAHLPDLRIQSAD